MEGAQPDNDSRIHRHSLTKFFNCPGVRFTTCARWCPIRGSDTRTSMRWDKLIARRSIRILSKFMQFRAADRHWFCKVAFPPSCQIKVGGSEAPGSNWRFEAESSAVLMDTDIVFYGKGSCTKCIWSVMGKVHTRQLRLHGVKQCRRYIIRTRGF